MDTPERVVLGRIVGAHGIRGRVRVRCFGDGPGNLLRLSRVMLGESAVDDGAVAAKVLGAEPGRRGEIRLALAGVSGREEAKRLRGRLVMVEPEKLEALPEGEYYAYQLVGCRVEGEDGRAVGTVREIWSTGAPDILVVESEAGEQHLISTGGDRVREVDVEGRRIVIEVIPGLLDAT